MIISGMNLVCTSLCYGKVPAVVIIQLSGDSTLLGIQTIFVKEVTMAESAWEEHGGEFTPQLGFVPNFS